MASSTNAVPGSSTVPEAAWSASHACVCRASRPVSTIPPDSASTTAAPSSGCPAADSPAAVTSSPPAEASSQKRRRWNAYVGSSTLVGEVPPPTAVVRSAGTPFAYASAAEVRKRAGPPSSRRSVPVA